MKASTRTWAMSKTFAKPFRPSFWKVIFLLATGGLLLGIASKAHKIDGLYNAAFIDHGFEQFKSGFEQNFTGWGKDLCCQHSAQIVTSPVREGTYAAQFNLNRSDPDVSTSRRAEVKLRSVPMNDTYTYRFSIFLPESYVADPSYEILAQWHDVPDVLLGENWKIPSLALIVQNRRWGIHQRWDPNPVTRNNEPGAGGGSLSPDLGPYQTNRWTDWTFKVHWSHQANGLIEVWQNNKLVYKRVGPNTYNDRQGPFLKLGIYKPDWKYNPQLSKLSERVLFLDAVSVQRHRENLASH